MSETGSGSYIIPILSNGSGAVVNYIITNGFASPLVRKIITDALWVIICIGTFALGLTALCIVLTKEHDVIGTVGSLPLGFFGQSCFPLIVLWVETFKFPSFGFEYLTSILIDYAVIHLIAGVILWLVVLLLLEVI